jgi:hypothetical protein
MIEKFSLVGYKGKSIEEILAPKKRKEIILLTHASSPPNVPGQAAFRC